MASSPCVRALVVALALVAPPLVAASDGGDSPFTTTLPLPTLPTLETTTTTVTTTTVDTVPDPTTTLPAPTTTVPAPTTTVAEPTTTSTTAVPAPTSSTSLPVTSTSLPPPSTTTTLGAPPLCSARDCDDGIACTEDRCVDGACRHEPRNDRCTDGGCRPASCRPYDDHADRRGCVAEGRDGGKGDTGKGDDGDGDMGKGDGGNQDDGYDDGKGDKKRHGKGDNDEAVARLATTGEPECMDDGFSCTDDVCTASGCMHVPVDSRCVPANACTTAVCMPGDPSRDDAGCVSGPPRAEGSSCADDGRVCTRDVCRDGACVHESIADTASCAPVEGAFRHALALGRLTFGLAMEIHETVPDTGTALRDRLSAIERALDAAAAALAGAPEAGLRPAVTGSGASPVATDRARIAFTQVLHTPRQVTNFLDLVAAARTRQDIQRPQAREFRRRGRLLLRGTRMLKGELARLRRPVS